MKVVLAMLLIVIAAFTGSCKDKINSVDNKNKKDELVNLIEFEKKGGVGGINFDTPEKRSQNQLDYLPYEILITSDTNMIYFSDIEPQSGGMPREEQGIPYKTYKKDIEKKQISCYLENGMLVITVEFIDNDHFKIVEVGEWFHNISKSNDPIIKKIDEKSGASISNFIFGDYYKTDRIYTVN